jgi:uncharacterized C2H2 Zn-finger protein
MPECPYCGRWFKTKRGLETHIAKVHKPSLIRRMLGLGPKKDKEAIKAHRTLRKKKRGK